MAPRRVWRGGTANPKRRAFRPLESSRSKSASVGNERFANTPTGTNPQRGRHGRLAVASTFPYPTVARERVPSVLAGSETRA